MNLKIALSGLCVLLLSTPLVRCSIIMPKDDPADSPAHFEESAAVVSNVKAVPAEIASDFEKVYAKKNRVTLSPGVSVKEEALQSVEPVFEEKVERKASARTLSKKEKRVRAPTSFLKQKASSSKGLSAEDYRVKEGDTLMKISFEKYGNIYRWKEIYEANKEKISNFNALPTGTLLTINGDEYVVIQRDGKPYLIRRNDTLVKISGKLYGTPKYWSSLWHNNEQLIHDPNKIYAGFTLYYLAHPETPAAAPILPAENGREKPLLEAEPSPLPSKRVPSSK